MALYYYYDLLYYYRTVISNNKTSIGAARKTARRSRENDIVGVVAQLGGPVSAKWKQKNNSMYLKLH